MDKEVKIQIAIMYHYLKQSMDESQALLYMLSLIFYRTYSELMDQELSVFVEHPYRELGDNSRIVNKGIGTDLQLYIPLPSQLFVNLCRAVEGRFCVSSLQNKVFTYINKSLKHTDCSALVGPLVVDFQKIAKHLGEDHNCLGSTDDIRESNLRFLFQGVRDLSISSLIKSKKPHMFQDMVLAVREVYHIKSGSC